MMPVRAHEYSRIPIPRAALGVGQARTEIGLESRNEAGHSQSGQHHAENGHERFRTAGD